MFARKPKRLPPTWDDPEQSRLFIDMAREVEANESSGAMDRALNRANLRQSVQPPSKRRSPARDGQSEER